MESVNRQLDELQRQLARIQNRLEIARCVDPVFVLGCPRSGTSVLSWALAQHPAFWTGPESNFLYEIAAPADSGVSRLKAAFDKANAREDGWLRANAVGYDEFAAAVGFGFHTLFASRSLGKRWVDSSTENVLVAEELARMFPNGRFLHVVRDGRAVVASLLSSGFDLPWAKDFAVACRTWVQFVEAGRGFQQAYPQRMLEVRNERFVESCDAVFEFLGVPRCDATPEFLRTQRVNSSYGNRTPHDIKRHKPPELLGRSDLWKFWNEAQVRTFDEIAGPTLRLLDYSASPALAR